MLIKYENKPSSTIDSYYSQRPTLLTTVQRVHLYVTAIMSWNADIAYAFTPYKILSLPLGLWPLQKYTTFSLIRTIVCGFSLVRFYFSFYTSQCKFSAICIFDISSSTVQARC